MSNPIRLDPAGIPEQPTFVLATRSGQKLGPLRGTTGWKYHKLFNGADEIYFDVHKYSGTDVNPLWDQVRDYRFVWYAETDTWFQIAMQLDEADDTIKHITGTAVCESELSQTNVYDLEINTEDDIARDDYVVTVFYDPENADGSLLNRVLYKLPHYTIGHVDNSLRHVQRPFSWSDTSVYDVFMEIAEEVGCLFVFDSGTDNTGGIARTVNAYDLQSYCAECGKRFEGHYDTCPYCGSSNITEPYGDESGIIISRENLSNDITLTSDQDATKNCFRLVAGDDAMTAAVRFATPDGSGYLWHISDEMKEDMSDALVQKLDDYDTLYDAYYNSHNYTVNSTAYNALVDQYDSGHETYSQIVSGGTSNPPSGAIVLSNYPKLTEAFYTANDFCYYLHDSMMPSYTITTYTIQEQAARLKTGLTAGVAMMGITTSTSSATVETAIKSLARHYVDTGMYNLTITTTSWVPAENAGTWRGSVLLTDRTDSTVTASTGAMTVAFTSDPEAYTQQLLQIKIDAVGNETYDISGLFAMSLADFQTAIESYALVPLQSFYACCETCLDVLIEQGCGNPDGTTIGGIAWADAYTDIYQPWYQKLMALRSEIDARAAEVDTVQLMLDALTEHITSTHEALDFESFVGTALWEEFIPYRREDTYSNTNFISDGLSNAEIVEYARQFIEQASVELYKSSVLQHSISSSLHNLLIIPEFAGLVDHFDTGVWIRILVDDTPYRLRLLEYTIDWDNNETIDVQFSDVDQWKDGFSDIQSILKSAQSMATSYSATTRKAERGNTAASWFDDGVNASLMKIINNAHDESMTFDENGLKLMQYDELKEIYSPEQLKILHNILAFTDDDWETVRVAIGKIVIDGEEKYGVLAANIYGKFGKFVELDADTIKTGTLSADRLAANSITADKLDATTINASGMLTVGALDSTASTAISNGNTAYQNAASSVSTKTEYYLSTSSSSATGSSIGWQSDIPTWSSGKYVWTRIATTVTPVSGSATTTYQPSANGAYDKNLTSALSTAASAQTTANGAVGSASVKTEYYLSTSSTSATGSSDGWQATIPTWSSGKYIWTRVVTTTTPVSGSASTTYQPSSAGVYDANLTTALSTAASAASAASAAQATANGANAQEQTIYKQAVSGTNSMSGTTTWITASGESVSSDTAGLTPVWTTKRPTYRSKYPVLFVATQRKTVAGTVTCTTPLKDDTTTIIDGGHITTGTIDASQVTVTNIDASKITVGKIQASQINTGSITVGSLSDGDNYSTTTQMNTAISDAIADIEVGGRNLVINTLTPTVSNANLYPRLISQPCDTVIAGTPTVATHGLRTTVTSAQYPAIRFGATNTAISTLNGLQAGRTYTLSFDGAWKILSGTVSGTGNSYMRITVISDGNTVGTMDQSQYYNFATITSAQRGTPMTGRCEYTFTIPTAATMCYILIRPSNTTNTAHASGDYIEVSNLKLEQGDIATAWTPAPEDLTAVANAQEQRIYYRSSSTTAPSVSTADSAGVKPSTTWVTSTSTANTTWTTKRMQYDSTYKYLWTCVQRKTVDGSISCSTVLLDDTTTVIDGGNIITGTVTANQLNTTNINASGILTVGALDSDANTKITNGNTAYNRATAFRGTCATGATTAAKVVTCSNFTSTELVAGAAVVVYCSTANTKADAPLTLQVGSSTAKTIYVAGAATSATNQLLWVAGASITFVYDGTYWRVEDNPGTWTGTTCSVAVGTAAKTSTVSGIVLFNGVTVSIPMTYANTNTSATLNVSSLGAKNIYYGTTTTSPTTANGRGWIAGRTVDFRFDGAYWRVKDTATIIDGGHITTGTIDASKVTVTNLNASNITSGTISADMISGGTISGSAFVSSSNLSGETNTLGMYSAGMYWTYQGKFSDQSTAAGAVELGMTTVGDALTDTEAVTWNLQGLDSDIRLGSNQDITIAGSTIKFYATKVTGLQSQIGGRNLSRETGNPTTITPSGTNSYGSPYGIYSVSDYGRSLITNTANTTFTVSYDYSYTDADTATTVLCSLRQTSGSYSLQSNATAAIQVGSGSGHAEGTFTMTDGGRTYGTAWLFGGFGSGNRNIKFIVSNFKFELGPTATSWTPAPEDGAAGGVEYIAGTQTSATNAWTGRTASSTLYTGKTIAYYLPYAGTSTAATLNLTLADGSSTTGAKTIRWNGTGSVTTHYSAGAVILMVYDGTYWKITEYNSDTYNRVRHQNVITASAAITSGRIICGNASGYRNIAASVSFDIAYPLMYANATLAAAATGDNNYLKINGVTASSNGGITSGTIGKMLWLKGTLSGTTFTILSSGFLTTVTPTAAESTQYYYIPLGIMYSTTQIYFNPQMTPYTFQNGKFTQAMPSTATFG